MIFEDCSVTFQKVNEDIFNYYIYLQNKQQDKEDEQNQEEEYYIPIRSNMIIFNYSVQVGTSQAIGFQWKFEDSWLQLQFDEGIDAQLFQTLTCNLIF